MLFVLASFMKSKNKRTGTIVKMIYSYRTGFHVQLLSAPTERLYAGYKPGLQRYGMVIGLGVPLKLLKINIITSVDVI